MTSSIQIVDPVIAKDVFSFIDLCSGTGGFHMAMDNVTEVKSQVLLAADISDKCRQVYKLNHGIDVYPNLTTLKMSDHQDFDAIFAGFPCQPFSFAGKRLGLDDSRGTIIHDILSMVKIKQPKLVCLENVKGLKSMKNTDQTGAEVMAYKLIYSAMEELGYYVTDRVISPHEINIPQVRERVVIVCVRKDLVKDEEITSTEEYGKKVLEYVEKLIAERKIENENYEVFESDEDAAERFQLNDTRNSVLDLFESFVSNPEWDNIDNSELQEVYKTATGAKRCAVNFKQSHFFMHFRHFAESRDIPASLMTEKKRSTQISQEFFKTSKKWNILYDNHDGVKTIIDDFFSENEELISTLKFLDLYLEYSGGEDFGSDTTLNSMYCQFRQSGVRIRKGTTFPTLVKSGPRPVLINKRRFLTNVEMARLQSLRDGFQFIDDHSAMQQCGNAVNVQVIELMLRGGLSMIYPERFE